MMPIPEKVLAAVRTGPLPLYVYDSGAARERVASAASLLDKYYFPVKACPEPAIVKAVVETGCGLDLCSSGDVDIASISGCPGTRWSFTSPHIEDGLLRRLLDVGAVFDADSVEQALRWKSLGGTVCGLRIAVVDPGSSYGIKFGVPVSEVGRTMELLDEKGVTIIGIHVHETHAARSPMEMADRLRDALKQLPRSLLGVCRFVNIGGGWPVQNGGPVPFDNLSPAFRYLRSSLSELGFPGVLAGEPGEWIVGPCGYLAARVSAVKHHPADPMRRILILDTATPVPCRASVAPFVLIRDGETLTDFLPAGCCDIFGSANTGTDLVGFGVPLPEPFPGDVVVSLGQGAYTRSLTGSFNERSLPVCRVV